VQGGPGFDPVQPFGRRLAVDDDIMVGDRISKGRDKAPGQFGFAPQTGMFEQASEAIAFQLRLSMIAALGSALRPAASRSSARRSALDAYVRQSGRQVVYRADEVRSARSPGARGPLSAEAALANLLAGSGFTTRVDGNLVAIVKSSGNGQSADSTSSLGADTEQADNTEIIVTGSRIAQARDQFQQTVTQTREEMDLAGQGTVAEVLASLPQNFGGGVSGDTTRGGNLLGPGGASINLRGLPPSATLTLLSGRRVAPSGGDGSYVDISVIPTVAIDRIEVLADGASAIYGSDAVAGVANVILRRSYEGAETRMRFGTTTQGGGEDVLLSQIVGANWNGGSALISYEYQHQDRIDANDRDFARSAPDPNDLSPQNERHSIYAAGSVAVADSIELIADGYFSDRKSSQTSTIITAQGASGSTPLTFSQPSHVQTYGSSIGVESRILASWKLNAQGFYSHNDFRSTNNFVTEGGGSLFESNSSVAGVEATIGGPLFHVMGNTARLVLGVQFRNESYSGGIAGIPSGVVTTFSDNSRDIYALFGEALIPIFEPQNSVFGVSRFSISLSGRYEPPRVCRRRWVVSHAAISMLFAAA
jgi:outer membrane receptor protein involved in Fe transport